MRPHHSYCNHCYSSLPSNVSCIFHAQFSPVKLLLLNGSANLQSDTVTLRGTEVLVLCVASAFHIQSRYGFCFSKLLHCGLGLWLPLTESGSLFLSVCCSCRLFASNLPLSQGPVLALLACSDGVAALPVPVLPPFICHSLILSTFPKLPALRS